MRLKYFHFQSMYRSWNYHIMSSKSRELYLLMPSLQYFDRDSNTDAKGIVTCI
jgi:hypothetical protein